MIKFTIGARVTLKDTGEKGVITAIESRERILVEVDGFEIPLNIREVLADEPLSFEPEPLLEVSLLKTAIKTENFSPQCAWHLAWLAERNEEGLFTRIEALFLNQTNVECIITGSFSLDNQVQPIAHFPPPNSSISLAVFDFSDFNFSPEIFLEIQFHPEIPGAVFRERPKAARLLRPPTIIPITGQMGWFSTIGKPIKLIEKHGRPAEGITAITINPEDLFSPPASKNRFEPFNLPEVEALLDLHAEKLPGFSLSMGETAIFAAQQSLLRARLNRFLAEDVPTLVVIHGKGSGMLREKVHAIIRGDFPGLTVEHRFDPRFDAGASFVYKKPD